MPFFRPNAVTLINVFDRGLIRNALFECERSPGDIHWTAGAEEARSVPVAIEHVAATISNAIKVRGQKKAERAVDFFCIKSGV